MRKTIAIVASFFILVIAGGVAVVRNMDDISQPVTGFAATKGWCCMSVGKACVPNQTPFSCSEGGGLAFSASEDNCAIACTSFPER